LLSVPAAAVDGEILIDQAKVNAGGITPGDAPGFPATLSRPGRYKLTGNLAVPAGSNGIEVTQHNVTIDLNGFTIGSAKPPSQSHAGVQAPNVSGLRVTNGTIAGFQGYGIYNHDGAFAVVEDMRFLSNGTGVYVETESHVRNTTIANGGRGVDGCSRCLIEQNVIAGNSSVGIVAGGAAVIENVIVSNGSHGLASGIGRTGYGSNILSGNNAAGSGTQVSGPAFQLHPNVCEPACP